MKRIKISPVHLIPVSFLVTILIGTLLLMLPAASAPGAETGLITAAFTSTTSVCVTGLVVVDTYAHWSPFGQLIILILVQIGGLGVVAVGSMIMLIGRKKFTLGDRKLLGDSLNIEKNKGLLAFLKRIFKGVFFVELAGTLLFCVKLIPLLGIKKGIWASVFQSVSAFCNAGMDVIGPNSMIDFQDSPYLMGITMVLIVLGGLGFVVWFDVIDGINDVIRHRRSPGVVFRHLPVHSKLVLIMTFVLLFFGTLCVFFAEYNNPATIGTMPLPEKLLNCLFQSVTFRTAGFASVPQDKLTEASCLVGYVLMFIGGSPVGTAGGVKTVTFVVVIFAALSAIKNEDEVKMFSRGIEKTAISKAAAVITVSFMIMFISTVLLSAVSDANILDIAYETVSATATVGLTRNFTPSLNIWGKIIIITTMYLGRVGPISLLIAFNLKMKKKNIITVPVEQISIG